MQRLLWGLLAALLGFGLGFVYGRLLEPVQIVDLSPPALRADFRTDYILMVAEAYWAERDLDLAMRRLALLGNVSPVELVTQALTFAEQAHFSLEERALLESLAQALRNWYTSPGAAP